MKKPRRANGAGSFRTRPDGRVEYKTVLGRSVDGSLIRKSFYGATEKEARDKYKSYLRSNPPPVEKAVTLKDWSLTWLAAYKKGKVTDGTYYEYDLIIKNVINAQLGDLRLSDIRQAHVELLMRSVSEGSASRQKKVCWLIHVILASALKNHYITENVADGVRPPRQVKKEIQIFSRSEIKKLMTFDHPFAPIVKLMFLTGMRRGELLALSWRSVDFEAGVIRVSQALSDGRIKDTTKGKRDRSVPITAELKAVLHSIPKTKCPNVLCVGDRAMSKDQFNYRFRRFVELAGVEYKSAHKARHSFITYMLNSGAKIHNVQRIAGHAAMATTEKYTHVDVSEMPKDMRKLKY